MSEPNAAVSGGARFPGTARKPAPVAAGHLTRAGYLERLEGFPLVVQPTVDGLDPASWAGAHRAWILDSLYRDGAILFRGFDVRSPADFSAFASALTPDLLDYQERAAPRSEVADKVFTSTEFPADQAIPLHHEMSYSHHWPAKILFYCEQPAREGGATPIADDRKVLQRIDARVKQRFMDAGVMYVRNYGHGVDLSWQEAFQTEDRGEVEAYCRRSGIAFEWLPEERLRTRQVRQAVAVHPRTGDVVWFNHAHMFHISNMPAGVAEALLDNFADDELPRNAFYGDGSPIEASVLDEIRAVYDELAVVFEWRQGDVMLLDNFHASHGRQPFAGSRRVLVAMAELYEGAAP